MRIKKTLSTHRNDFHADYGCEHCGFVKKNYYGYNDANFHGNVIPPWFCAECGKNRAGETTGVEL